MTPRAESLNTSQYVNVDTDMYENEQNEKEIIKWRLLQMHKGAVS